jgi:hypothetical protein
MNSTGEMGTQWMNLMQALPSMKLLQKMVAVTAGMVVIVWMIAYWIPGGRTSSAMRASIWLSFVSANRSSTAIEQRASFKEMN